MSQANSNTPYFWFKRLKIAWFSSREGQEEQRGGLRGLEKEYTLPRFVQSCPMTLQMINWLRLFRWDKLPLRRERHWFGRKPVPPAAYIGAFLVKLDQHLMTISHLRRFLLTHPGLIWVLGFPLVGNHKIYGFDPEASLPSQRHFNRVLRELPNEQLQILLDEQVNQLKSLMGDSFGQTISLDTKHILAWVRENNPKQYIKEGRFDKTRQPSGDPDCTVGCKRKHNRQITSLPAPTCEGQPASVVRLKIGEYYWGYASGIVVAKVAGWGEFVLAEMTQTFDKGDTTYFFPLMEQVKKRLGFKPRYGTLDAAFDAFYIYDYFHSPDHDGFAAVPLSEKGGKPYRKFDENGLPLCDAGLSMPLKFAYHDRTTTIIPYERAKHVCPLLYPQATDQTCPIVHKNWVKGGCETHLANTPGSRIRHQLDRQSARYLAVYRQRTAVERIFAQALDLGIERPKLRNQQAIVNLNSLTYLLINLRALQRVLEKRAESNK